MNPTGTLTRPHEGSKRPCDTAPNVLSGTLESAYSTPAEAPRFYFMDPEDPSLTTPNLQMAPLRTSNMSYPVGSGSVAASASYHDNSPVPGQQWRGTSQYETYGSTPRLRDTYNVELLNNRCGTYLYAQGSDTFQSGSGLYMKQVTAVPGFYSKWESSYPTTWAPNKFGPLAPSGSYQPSRDRASLASVEMQRQPANIGYEVWPDQRQDPSNYNEWENLPFGHDTGYECQPWQFHSSTANPVDRRHSNIDDNWSLLGLPRPASMSVSNPWR
ncbi:hypothetical protein MMC26_002051 [Xylographa opegraphella]|nr:hypothetical protein [Xylographa opegraphella]